MCVACRYAMINTFKTSDWSAEGRDIEGAARQSAGGGSGGDGTGGVQPIVNVRCDPRAIFGVSRRSQDPSSMLYEPRENRWDLIS